MSLRLLWVLAHSFHKYPLSKAGDRMLCLYNHCCLLRLKPSQHISVQQALSRRSLFLRFLQHGPWVTAQLGERLEKNLTSIRKTYPELQWDSLAPNFLHLHLSWPLGLGRPIRKRKVPRASSDSAHSHDQHHCCETALSPAELIELLKGTSSAFAMRNKRTEKATMVCSSSFGHQWDLNSVSAPFTTYGAAMHLQAKSSLIICCIS